MERACAGVSPRLWPAILIPLLILLAGSPGHAENVDPNNDGSHFAWSENLGWIDALAAPDVGRVGSHQHGELLPVPRRADDPGQDRERLLPHLRPVGHERAVQRL